MVNIIDAFPLEWPLGYPRHEGNKTTSRFICTLDKARNGILREIKLLKGKDVIISTNIPLRRDGTFYASLKPVSEDLGVAVYFTYKNEQKVVCCDAYKTIMENIRAIEKSINAIRSLENWKCSDILNQAFSGFKALPEKEEQTCWRFLKIAKTNNLTAIRSAYTTLAKNHHPDAAGGSHEKFIELKLAYEQAIKEITHEQP